MHINMPEMQLNQKAIHKLWLHRHLYMLLSIIHEICESLMKIQHFRRENSSQLCVKMLKKSIKYRYTKICVIIKHIICECLVKR